MARFIIRALSQFRAWRELVFSSPEVEPIEDTRPIDRPAQLEQRDESVWFVRSKGFKFRSFRNGNR